MAEQETKLNRDLHNRSDDEEGVKRHRSLSPAKMFLPMLDAPSVPMFSTPDFGGFSQILEKHMREIKTEPSATITHEMDLSSKDKVVCDFCLR